MLPYIEPKISDTQAGFRKDRGCRDNVVILVSAIQHLLDQSSDTAKTLGIITYILHRRLRFSTTFVSAKRSEGVWRSAQILSTSASNLRICQSPSSPARDQRPKVILTSNQHLAWLYPGRYPIGNLLHHCARQAAKRSR